MKNNEDGQPLDGYEREILNYLLQNPGITPNKVVIYMNNNKSYSLSRITTLKRIDALISRGILDDRKERNSFHRLYVNDKTQFNIIYQEVTRVEAVMEVIFEPSRRRLEAKVSDDHPTLLLVLLFEPYLETVSTMLRVLTMWTHLSKMSDGDKQLLYEKISQAMIKFNREPSTLMTAKHFLARNKRKLHLTRKMLADLRSSERSFLDINAVDNLIKRIEHFDIVIANLQKLL